MGSGRPLLVDGRNYPVHPLNDVITHLVGLGYLDKHVLGFRVLVFVRMP